MNKGRPFRYALLLPIAALLLQGGLIRAQDSTGANGANGVAAGDAGSLAANPPSGSSDSILPADNAAPETGDQSSQSAAYQSPVAPGVEGLNRVGRLSPDAFSQYDPTGLPYSSVPFMQRTGGDLNNISSVSGNPFNTDIGAPLKMGSGEGGFNIQTAGVGLVAPFPSYGGEPQDADVKAGPFYIKFRDLDGLVLYDDNYLRRERNRRAETIVLLRLNLDVIAQITDNLQFAVSGSIIYLPLQNQVGVVTSAYNSLGLLLYAVPAFAAQIAYNTIIDGWPVTFFDQFRINSGTYSDSIRDNFQLFRGGYLVQDENGGYVFHSSHDQLNSNSSNNGTNFDDSVIYASNTIGASTDREIPGDIRLTVQAVHEDLWYNNGGRGLPPGRDYFYAAAVSQRENERFKPFASYQATYVEGSSGVTQTVQVGIFGPIDDQLFLRAWAGYYFGSGGGNGALYSLTLQHTAGEYTYEELEIERQLSDFDDQVVTSEYYRLNQILGPTLIGTAFLAHAEFENISNDHSVSHTDDFAGLQLSWYIGPKTNLLVSGIYAHQQYSGGSHSDTFTGRAILNRIVTDSLTFQLLYQYQRSDSSAAGQSYYDNLFYFRFIKYFD